MRLHVVFNTNGEILAAAHSGSSPIRARPVADEQAGQRVAEVYLPVEYHHYDMGAVCHRLRIDVAGKFPELKTK